MKSATGILTVNLSAILANWRCVTSQLSKGSSAAAVIKANAYGLGAAQVGPVLYRAGCREFFVATLDEAVAARKYLKADAVIYVLGGLRVGTESLFLQHKISPVLHSTQDIRRWLAHVADIESPPECAVKINTGMTRLGLDVQEWTALVTARSELQQLSPALVMSHLACADEPGHALNREQLQQFQAVVATSRSLLPQARYSLANSSGIYLGKEWHFDLVRPGAALYGINPRPQEPSPLKPVVHLALPILQVRQLTGPVSIGYGATVNASAPTRLAVAAGGYADGLHRTIGGAGFGVIGRHQVPVIGRISMDATIFDVSAAGIAADEAKVIEVLNDELTVDSWAARTGALGYEVLTSLGYRYQRRYVKDGVLVESELC